MHILALCLCLQIIVKFMGQVFSLFGITNKIGARDEICAYNCEVVCDDCDYVCDII